MTPMRLAATLALAALALASCETTPSEPDRVRGAAQTFVQSCAEGEGVAASEGLTESTREEFLAAPGVLAGCRHVLGLPQDSAAARSPEQLRDARIAEADAHGGIGSALVELPGG